MELNKGQKRSLEVLETLLAEEASIYERSRAALADSVSGEKAKKVRGRIKNTLLFLTTAVQSPRWDQSPEMWALDWCDGWAIKPQFVFAEALGITRSERVRTIKADGKALKESYFIWTQSTAFNFRTGYTIHTYPREHSALPWCQQLPHNSMSIRIEDAMPAMPVDEAIGRDCGRVDFTVFRAPQVGAALEPVERYKTTQDEFVRYLITGELREPLDE